MKFLVVLAVLVALTSQQFTYGQEFNYLQNGDDWTGVCATGQTQSPVNIESSAVTMSDAIIQFNYASNGIIESWKTENNNVTVEISQEGTNTWNHEVVAANQRYSLLQMHFHRRSEHTTDGNRYDMEIHMVHTPIDATNTANLVVGLLVSQSARADADSGMQAFIDNIRTRGIPERGEEIIVEDCKTDQGDCIDLYALFGYSNVTHGSFINYDGSLTTPPCSEPVRWYVAKKTFKADISNFTVYTPGDNYRNTQNARNPNLTLVEVQSSKPSSSSVVRGSFILTLICVVAQTLQL